MHVEVEVLLQLLLLLVRDLHLQLLQQRRLYVYPSGWGQLLFFSVGYGCPEDQRARQHCRRHVHERRNILLIQLFSTLVRVGITATTVLVAYLILSNAEPYKSNAQDLTAPMVVIGVLAFAISSFFVSLYSEAMEAVYCCYLADKDAGGGEDKAPEELKDFLQEAKEDGHWVE